MTMPQVVRKTTQAVNAVQGSKRQTYNSTKGEVLLICDEDALSESQQLVYSEHDEKMKVYTQALDAYNKAYGKLDTASGQAEGTSQKAPTASLSCEGNGIVQNGVVPPQQSLQQKPIQQAQQPQPQQTVSVPIVPAAKKPTVVTGGTWRPQVVANFMNKTVVPPTLPVSSNMVTSQQLVPRVVSAVNPAAPRAVIQVPVGTDLTNMQVVNIAGASGNYQLVLQPQVAYPTLNATSVVSQPTVPVGPSVLPQPGPVQSVMVPVTATSRPANPVTNQIRVVKAGNASSETVVKQITNQVKVVSARNASAGQVASIQAVSVSSATRSSSKDQAKGQAGSNKRAAPEHVEQRRSKRSKADSAPSQPDVVDNYYGWKQGRPWWDDDKPRGSFRCYVCNKKLPTNIRYMQHVRHHLEKEQQQNSVKNNISSCRSCFKHFKTPHALQYHTKKYHEYCKHRCGICEEPFEDSQSLLKHLSRNHQSLQMPYVCGVCNYASSIYDDLILHFNKDHEGSKTLMCPFCVRIIRCNNSFLRHCKTHLSVSIKSGLFHCRSCKLMFLNNAMLKEHQQEDHKLHSLQDRNGVPSLPSVSKGKPAEAVPVQKVSFPKQTHIKVSPSLWSRREIIKPRGHLRCLECGMTTDHCKDHFRQKMRCTRCKYITYCGPAFANHMIVFHKAGSTPKLHRIRKTIVNNGRILLGCRNCEFSTLSPTLMTCHIESCPRGSLTIESFKVRTHSLQSSRHYKREVISVNMKTTKPAEDDDDDDDDVVVIEDEVLVDLTDDAPSSSKESEPNSPKPTAEESKVTESLLKNVSLTVKLEKLPNDLNLDKLMSGTGNNNKDNNKETCSKKDPEVENQEQSSTNDEEKMEVDKSSNEDDSNDSTAKKAPSEDAQNNASNAGEPAGVVDEEKSLHETVDDSSEASKDKDEKVKSITSEDQNETSEDQNETSDNRNETSEDKTQTFEDKNETSDEKSETSDDKNETSDDKNETSEDKNETSENKNETCEDKNVTSEDKNETKDKSETSKDKNETSEDKNKISEDKNKTKDKSETSKDKNENSEDKSETSEDKNESSEDSGKIDQTEEVRIKQERIDS